MFLLDVPAMMFTVSVGYKPNSPEYTVTWKLITTSSHVPAVFGHTLSIYSSSQLLLVGGVKRACLVENSDCYRDATAFLLRLNDDGMTGTLTPFFNTISTAFAQVVSNGSMFGGVVLRSPTFRDDEQRLYSSTNNFFNWIPPNHCPQGHFTDNKTGTCEKCPLDTFSNNLLGTCLPCSQSTITVSNGSIECIDPGPCHFTQNYCNGRGDCYYKTSTKELACNCTTFGYWNSNNCYAPMVQIISSSCALFTLGLATCLIFVIRKARDSRKRSQERERQLKISRWQLKELANGVIVQWGDLRPLSVLGEGSVGTVQLAQLGDMKVAVKTLRQCIISNGRFLERFSREIENMRTVRHSNIIMFLGAGTVPETNYPFIVMEYATRGSLFQLLQDDSISVSHLDRMMFALDTARGMEHLHGLSTPRLHCDLKSSNLLVTGDGAIKIADFGMLRLVSTLRDTATNQTNPEDRLMANVTVHSRSICNSNLRGSSGNTSATRGTALATDSAGGQPYMATLTQAMGTVRWCAPEIIQGNSFTKYTDVYRYAGYSCGNI